MASPGTRAAKVPHPLDFESEWQRAGDEAGATRALSRNSVRTLNSVGGGSGTTDVVRLGEDVVVNVVNCQLPHLVRWGYAAEEALIMLRASLACDVRFRYGALPAMVFNRPELTLACLPKGLQTEVDIAGGTRQQGIIAVFRASTFARRHGLREDELPPELSEALSDDSRVGRIATFPVDQRIAALIADTLDSRLEGELRVLQIAGRVGELVAFALDAMLRQRRARTALLPRRRDLDLAQAARARLDQDYRHPPSFAALARDLGTNQNKLKAVFKASFGTTMVDYCLERRVREAQQLLLEAQLTIAQVAERAGYEHQSSFTAAFRRHVGMSPREYRRHRAPFSLELPAD